MCIAILNTSTKIKDKHIKNSWDNNDQGGGLLYNKDNKLVVFKTYDYDEFLAQYKLLRKDESIGVIVLHFRIATSGHERFTNLHPFLVNENLGFVHNGIISGLGNAQHSDTYQFNDILKGLPTDFLSYESMRYFISDFIGSSKLIFLNNKDEYTIINEKHGHWDKKGNWFSNDSYKAVSSFVYYGNNKVTKGAKSIGVNKYLLDDDFWGGSDDFSKDDTAWSYDKTMEDLQDRYFGVSHSSMTDFCDLTGISIFDHNLLWEIDEYCAFYNTTNIRTINSILKEELS